MGDQDNRFLLVGEGVAFKEKAGNLFSALSGVNYSPTQDLDGFLKSDPVGGWSQTMHSDALTKCTGQNKGGKAPDNRPRLEGHHSELMPPPGRNVLKRRSRPIPGHIMNPSKYTRYSLADVPDQQMTQKSNTAAALAFLREMDDKRNKDNVRDVPAGGKVYFKKPSHKSGHQTGQEELCSPTSDSFGLKTLQSKLLSKQKLKKEKEIKLSHLEYEDEE